MMKCSHATLIYVAGAVWLAVGLFLLPLGLRFLLDVSHTQPGEVTSPLMNLIAPYLGGRESTGLLLIALALGIGYYKGTYLLGKSANRVVNRIVALPNPTSLMNLYNLPYILLITVMILLGVGIKFFGVPLDIRGFIDVSVGAALIHGALSYFRMGRQHS